jgi:hypothetical protein
MNNKLLLWIMAIMLAIASFTDLIDGELPKLLGTVSLTLAIFCFALAGGRTGSKLNVVGYTFIFVALMVYVFRLIRHYHVL